MLQFAVWFASENMVVNENSCPLHLEEEKYEILSLKPQRNKQRLIVIDDSSEDDEEEDHDGMKDAPNEFLHVQVGLERLTQQGVNTFRTDDTTVEPRPSKKPCLRTTVLCREDVGSTTTLTSMKSSLLIKARQDAMEMQQQRVLDRIQSLLLHFHGILACFNQQ